MSFTTYHSRNRGERGRHTSDVQPALGEHAADLEHALRDVARAAYSPLIKAALASGECGIMRKVVPGRELLGALPLAGLPHALVHILYTNKIVSAVQRRGVEGGAYLASRHLSLPTYL